METCEACMGSLMVCQLCGAPRCAEHMLVQTAGERLDVRCALGCGHPVVGENWRPAEVGQLSGCAMSTGRLTVRGRSVERAVLPTEPSQAPGVEMLMQQNSGLLSVIRTLRSEKAALEVELTGLAERFHAQSRAISVAVGVTFAAVFGILVWLSVVGP